MNDVTTGAAVHMRLALIVTRWGTWPSFTPVYLHTLAHNRAIDFLLLGDRAPSHADVPIDLPANVRFLSLPLRTMLERMRNVTSSDFPGAAAIQDAAIADPSFFGGGGKGAGAKTNDFKPLLGECFPDLLSGYHWWGYIQEDMILGDLSYFLRASDKRHSLLHTADVITPNTGAPRRLSANGAWMLFRNTPQVRSPTSSHDLARSLSASGAWMLFRNQCAAGQPLLALLGECKRHAEHAHVRHV